MSTNKKVAKILELARKAYWNEDNEQEFKAELGKFSTETEKARYCAGVALSVLRLSNQNHERLTKEVKKFNSMIGTAEKNLKVAWSTAGYKQKEFARFLKSGLTENRKLFREIINLGQEAGLITTERRESREKIKTWSKD